MHDLLCIMMKPEHAKKEMSNNPSREDVHEQREDNQKREGVVKKDAPPARQSLIEKERADWEGMGGTQAPSPPKK